MLIIELLKQRIKNLMEKEFNGQLKNLQYHLSDIKYQIIFYGIVDIKS